MLLHECHVLALPSASLVYTLKFIPNDTNSQNLTQANNSEEFQGYQVFCTGRSKCISLALNGLLVTAWENISQDVKDNALFLSYVISTTTLTELFAGFTVQAV